jgi:hypothetical protein
VLTKEKEKAVLSAALFVVGIMIITSGAFASTSIDTFASTSNDLFIVSSDSGAEVKTMKLRAVKENEEVRKVSSFAISIENVVSVQRDGKVTVFSAPTSPTFTSAKITDINDNTVDIPITDAGVISLAGYSEGVYTLDVIVDDRYAYECIVVIGPEEGQQQIINKQITEVNQETDVNIIKKKFERGISKARVCLYTPSHPICKPVKGECPKGWAMNAYGQCYPYKQPCPPGYWRADYDESGACVKKPVICIQIYPPPIGCLIQRTASVNGTSGGNVTGGIGNLNATDTDTTSEPNATDTTPPNISPINDTQSDGSDDGGGLNATEPEPPVKCGEGEQLAPDGLSCEPIISEPPIECPEGEQLAADGLNCEPITAEEPTAVECGEGEELVDGQCQAIPIEETTLDEETEPSEEETETEDEETETEESEEDGGGGDGDDDEDGDGGQESGGEGEGGDTGGDEESASE